MKIDATAHNTIVVELSASDMKELEITYDEMDYSNIETRRVIWTLLDKARRALGRDIDPSGELEVDVLPDGSDGCVVLFTVNEQKASADYAEKNSGCNFIFETNDTGNLIDCAQQLYSLEDISSSELYTLKGSYRLILGVKNGCTCPLCAFEFLIRLNDACISETREHWQELCASDALISLCGKRSQV